MKVRSFSCDALCNLAFDNKGKQHKNGNTISSHPFRLRGDFVFTGTSTLFCASLLFVDFFS